MIIRVDRKHSHRPFPDTHARVVVTPAEGSAVTETGSGAGALAEVVVVLWAAGGGPLDHRRAGDGHRDSHQDDDDGGDGRQFEAAGTRYIAGLTLAESQSAGIGDVGGCAMA